MTIDSETNTGEYGYATKVVSLVANTDYTISAKGTTARLYGLKFTYDDGLVEETYDFTTASPATSWGCSSAGDVKVDGSNLKILENDYFDMKGRFAGGTK